MAAMLKFFRRHLPNFKLDWAETWWEVLERHRDSELLKSFRSDIQDGCHGGHLESLLPNHMLDWAETWWEALEWHRDSELLKSFRLAIQDGRLDHYGSQHDGRHWSDIEIQVAILKIFKPHLLQNGKSDWAKTWWDALGQHGDSELLKPFCYGIHDGRHSSHLEDLQLLAHLELCSRPAYAVVCWPWSVPHPYVFQ